MIKTELKKQLSLRKSNTVDLFVHWVPLTTSKNRQGKLAIVLGSRYNWLFNITSDAYNAKESARALPLATRYMRTPELIVSA